MSSLYQIKEDFSYFKPFESDLKNDRNRHKHQFVRSCNLYEVFTKSLINSSCMYSLMQPSTNRKSFQYYCHRMKRHKAWVYICVQLYNCTFVQLYMYISIQIFIRNIRNTRNLEKNWLSKISSVQISTQSQEIAFAYHGDLFEPTFTTHYLHRPFACHLERRKKTVLRFTGNWIRIRQQFRFLTCRSARATARFFFWNAGMKIWFLRKLLLK